MSSASGHAKGDMIPGGLHCLYKYDIIRHDLHWIGAKGAATYIGVHEFYEEDSSSDKMKSLLGLAGYLGSVPVYVRNGTIQQLHVSFTGAKLSP